MTVRGHKEHKHHPRAKAFLLPYYQTVTGEENQYSWETPVYYWGCINHMVGDALVEDWVFEDESQRERERIWWNATAEGT